MADTVKGAGYVSKALDWVGSNIGGRILSPETATKWSETISAKGGNLLEKVNPTSVKKVVGVAALLAGGYVLNKVFSGPAGQQVQAYRAGQRNA
jgi:hypothetical protein